MSRFRGITSLLFACIFTSTVHAQQEPDTLFACFDFVNVTDRRVVVAIDEGHHNFHTMQGRYSPFAKLLRQHGYQIKASVDTVIRPASLTDIDVLVIANPLNAVNSTNWSLPTPSAFDSLEIITLRNWVNDGGRLFLIADHMPFAGAADQLTSAFGIDFANAFAMDNRRRDLEIFTTNSGLNNNNPVTNFTGDTIATFTGSAFSIEPPHFPLITLDENYTLLLPEQAWVFDDATLHTSGENYLQLAAMYFGKGRIVVSGEAAMFTAQRSGPSRMPIGFNTPGASDNCELLIDILSWLSSSGRK